MRLSAVLACLTVAAIHPALAADPPPDAAAASGKETSAAVQAPVGTPTPSPAPATATPVSATAASAVPATTTATAAGSTPAAAASDADSDATRLEQHMHAKGYATRMENGQKIFCRREQVLGSRLGGALHCMNAAEARVNEERERQEAAQLQQRLSSGACISGGGAANYKSVSC